MNSDDEDKAIGSSSAQAAGFGPSDEPVVDLALNNDETLDTQKGDRRIWLVKVPKFLLERWQDVQEDGVELGRLRVYKKPMPNGDERIALLVPPSAQGQEEIPTEYSMTIQNKATKNTYIFAERDDVSIGEAGWEPGRGRVKPDAAEGSTSTVPQKRRMPTLTGTVHVGMPVEEFLLEHECNLTPRLDSASYRSIVRNRQAKAAEPKRKLQVLEGSGVEMSRLGIAGMSTRKFDNFIKGKAKPKAEANVKMARIPRNELLDMLFSAFETYDYWSIKNLRAHTQQPEVYLKEVLADIAQLHRRGPYAGMYSLQDTYKKRALAKSEGGDGGASGSGSGSGQGGNADGEDSKEGVKKEEDGDVKPSIPEEDNDEDDDDDIDMDAIA